MGEGGGGVTSEYITMQENSTGSNKCARACHISGWQGIKKEKIGGTCLDEWTLEDLEAREAELELLMFHFSLAEDTGKCRGLSMFGLKGKLSR